MSEHCGDADGFNGFTVHLANHDVMRCRGRRLPRQSSDGNHELDQWVRTFLCKGESTNTRALLVKLNRTIKETFTHVPRHEKGVQDPLLTLNLAVGAVATLRCS